MKKAAFVLAISMSVAVACDAVEPGLPAATAAEQTEQLSSACLLHPAAPRRTLDIDGDGFAEVAVGAPGARSVFLYGGTPAGLNTTAATTLVGPDGHGAAVAAAGDVDGDGWGEVIVGTGLGSVTLYRGTAAGLDPSGVALQPGDALRVGASVSTAGDVNGDGFDDVLVGTRYGALLYLGAAGGIGTAAAQVLAGPGSAALTVVGGVDFDRDGFGDVVVGSGNYGVNVYRGGPNGLSSTPHRTLVGSGGAAAAGDVNGDGHSDLLVASEGVVKLFAGNHRGLPARPLARLTGPGGEAVGDAVGMTLSSAGDVNGDGFDDVLVGTLTGDRAYLYLGRRRGPASAPVATLNGPTGSGFGATVAGVGDINGDGFGDAVIGARTAGNAFVFLGGPTGLTPSVTLTGPETFGESIAKTAR